MCQKENRLTEKERGWRGGGKEKRGRRGEEGEGKRRGEGEGGGGGEQVLNSAKHQVFQSNGENSLQCTERDDEESCLGKK